MIFNLSGREPSSVIARDNNGEDLTADRLSAFSKKFVSATGRRTLIFILAENRIASLAGLLASLSERIVPLLVGSNLDEDLLKRLMDTYRPEYLWISQEHKVSSTFKSIFRDFGYALLKTGMTAPALNDDLSLLLPTSGSTGSPKLVRHSYHNLEASASGVSAAFRITPDDRALVILPMQYTMGLSVITSHLYAGATVLLYQGALTEKEYWAFLKEEKASSFSGVPYSYEILSKLRFTRMQLPDLRVLNQGGGKLNDELFRELATYAKQTGKQFIASYGQTEGTARMAYLPPEKALDKTGSIGIAIPGGTLSLIDKDGNISEEGEAEGELVYRGPNVTLGYAETAGDLLKGDEQNEVLLTGDMARRDKDGYYYIMGRKKRFLKLFGLRISMDEIEQMVSSEFGIECLCKGDDRLMTVCITQDDIKEKVHNYLVEKTHLFHQAVNIQVLEELPRNQSGKLRYT